MYTSNTTYKMTQIYDIFQLKTQTNDRAVKKYYETINNITYLKSTKIF